MPIPFEVHYILTGRKRTREVIGVLCASAMHQRLAAAGMAGFAPPIYVSMGDVIVSWDTTSAGFEELQYDPPPQP